MAKSLFFGGGERCCADCVHGRPANDTTRVLCRKKGVVDPTFRCRRYRYDPLKRVPHSSPKLPHFDSGDFSL